MSLPKTKITKQPKLFANFSSFTKGWLRSAELVLGNDKETFAMLVLLFKKFSKQKYQIIT
jgi:hypothetical protein